MKVMKEIKKEDIELLSPAGDMECLIAAIQNGANAVYFGANQFNARANSKNFNIEEIETAINYAKIRNVKTHLTLNILIKNEEFEEALNLVNEVYNLGIDAVIVQDLGLAEKIKECFPSLQLHASTQTTIYNIDGVNSMAKVGFDRMVLARELSIDDIKGICQNTDKEIEVFIVSLTKPELDEKVLHLIDKEIPYHILFLLEHNDKYQAWIGYKEKSDGNYRRFNS